MPAAWLSRSRRACPNRHRHDDVGLDRTLDGQFRADALPARRRRCGPRPRSRAGRNRHIRRRRSATSAARTEQAPMPLGVTITISPGFEVAHEPAPMMSSAQVSEARTQAPSRSPSTSGRMPSGSRTPIIFFGRQRDQRIGAFELLHRVDQPVDVALAAGRDQMQDRFGVGGRGEDRALRLTIAARSCALVRLPLWAIARPPWPIRRKTAARCAARRRRSSNSGCGRWRVCRAAGR